MREVITTRNLSKSYGNFKAVDNVNLSIKQGEIYGLVGKNGAGKTTIFKMLMGITNVSNGEISILGSKNHHQLVAARKNIGFMMDSKFFPYLNAYQNIEYFRKLKGIVDPNETQRVLNLVELNGVKKNYKAFSMGMKQRLGIANAILGKPDIVILDEPVNGLDPQGIVDIRKLVLKMNREQGISFVISSHILSELALMAHRFGIIHKGKLIEEFSQEELHEKSQNGTLISTNDPSKTVALLEQRLNIRDYRINANNDIIVADNLNEPYRIAELLVNEGLQLNQLAKIESTLEDYFISLTGGEQ